MKSKLTVYIDNSIRQFLKESDESENISKLVNDALESYMSATLVRELVPPGRKKGEWSFPSLSEVEKRRPKSKGLTSAEEIIASQRRVRNESLS